MKYTILFFLLLVSVTCSGQIYQVDASGGGQIVRYYTSDSVWSKPVGLVGIQVIAIGGGGGGASGNTLTSGSCAGGKGGGGGALTRRYIISDSLASTYSVVIGQGGTGGVPSSTNTYNAGLDGGDTSFGSLVVADGGLGATTVTSGGTGGVIANCVPQGLLYSVPGGNGSNGGNPNSPVAGLSTGLATTGINGGGGGGGCTTTTPISYAGAVGGRMRDINYNQSTAPAGGVVEGGNGSNGLDNVSLQLDFLYISSAILTKGAGSGGAGGGGSNTTNGGNGGNGGLYGAGGGGGGGANRNFGNSGAGGNGAQGICIVIEYY